MQQHGFMDESVEEKRRAGMISVIGEEEDEESNMDEEDEVSSEKGAGPENDNDS